MLDAELLRRIAALSGLRLTPAGAAELVPSLLPLLSGDAEVRTLRLEHVSPHAPLWPEEDGG